MPAATENWSLRASSSARSLRRHVGVFTLEDARTLRVTIDGTRDAKINELHLSSACLLTLEGLTSRWMIPSPAPRSSSAMG